MSKRKRSSDFFQVRKIGMQWWVCQVEKVSPRSPRLIKKIEQSATRNQANWIADDCDEQYHIDLYIQQQWLAKKS